MLLDLNSGSGAVYGRGDAPPGDAAVITARINAHLDAALLARHRQQRPRDYLGGSRVGEPCARKLVYEITHAPKDRDVEPGILRVFDAGHQFGSPLPLTALVREILEALNQKTPDQIDILQGLVEAHQGLNQWDAMKACLDILAKKDLTVDQELWLIQKYLDSGYNQPAEARLASFQERHPDDNRGLLLDAWLEMMRGNLEIALTKTQRYLEKDTNSAGGWRLKGRIHRLLTAFFELPFRGGHAEPRRRRAPRRKNERPPLDH